MTLNLRQHRWYLTTAAVLAGFVVLAVILFGGSEESDGPLSPIAQAAEQTAKIPGARIELTGELAVPSEATTVEMTGSGVYNGKTDRSRITMNVTGGQPGFEDFTMTQVTEGFVTYQQMPQLEHELPDGKSWMKIDLSETLPDEAVSSIGTGGGLKQQFKQLEAVSSDAEDLGEEQIRGVKVVHYSATIDLSQQAEQLRQSGEDEAADQVEALIDGSESDQSPIEVWIDKRGYLRRMTNEIPFGGIGPSDATLRMSQDIYDFGIRPDIELPPEDEVFDATELVQESLEEMTEQ